MGPDVSRDGLGDDFVASWPKMCLIDVQRLLGGIKLTTQKNIESVRSVPLGFSIHRVHSQKPRTIRRSSGRVAGGHLLFEGHQRLMPVGEHGLPKTIELEFIGLSQD